MGNIPKKAQSDSGTVSAPDKVQWTHSNGQERQDNLCKLSFLSRKHKHFINPDRVTVGVTVGHSQVKHEMFNYAKRFEILSGYVQVAKQNTAQRIPHYGLHVKLNMVFGPAAD